MLLSKLLKGLNNKLVVRQLDHLITYTLHLHTAVKVVEEVDFLVKEDVVVATLIGKVIIILTVEVTMVFHRQTQRNKDQHSEHLVRTRAGDEKIKVLYFLVLFFLLLNMLTVYVGAMFSDAFGD